jgi:tetratricopeptide (TPR) repeat protein
MADASDDPNSELGAARLPGPSPAPPTPESDQTLPLAAGPGVFHAHARIGDYHVKRRIATGGMGVIYEALQEKPRRVVALKVMQGGVASPQALRRFELESQTLARLRHPGIAQIFEAGTHDDGSGPVPFFAMEYIPNAKTLTEYAAQKGLGMRERLGLFVQVCDAVYHGHQRGIIHRDLKPGNILVDSNGLAKVIDFGVARSTDSDLALTTMQTHAGQLIGTLQYMSPEQCESAPEDLDIRSDVYSLGIVLYELLSGRLPYDVSRVSVYEATRVIRDQPATRISAVQPTLRGDLETIVQKALEKDRERRYQSSFDLGQDVARFLRGDPITAHPPSITYQLRLFARRHRALFATGAAVVAALVLGVIVSTALYLRSEAARAVAAEERDRAREAEVRVEAINDFLVHDLLAAAKPEVAQGRKLTVEEVLVDAARRVDGAFPEHPELAASLRATLGEVFQSLGLYPLALAQIDSARAALTALRGESDAKTLQASAALASVYSAQSRSAEAESLYRATLALSRAALGGRDSQTLDLMAEFAQSLSFTGKLAEAESLAREALAGCERTLGPEDRKSVMARSGLADVLSAAGKQAEAESLYRRVIEAEESALGKRHPDRLMSLNGLSVMLTRQGRLSEAEPLAREIVDLHEIVYGEGHPFYAVTKVNLAMLLSKRGKHEEAIGHLQRSLTIDRETFGLGSVGATVTMRLIGEEMILLGRPAGADSVLREARAAAVKTLGEAHPEVWSCTVDIGWSLWERDRLAAAEPYFADTWRRRREALGESHGLTLRVAAQLASLWGELGHQARAESLASETLRRSREAFAPESPQVSHSLWRLGKVLMRAGRVPEAEAAFRESRDIQQKRARGEDTVEVAETESMLAESLTRLGRYEEAEELLERAYPRIRAARGAGYSRVRSTERRVRELYEAWGRPEKASRLLALGAGQSAAPSR